MLLEQNFTVLHSAEEAIWFPYQPIWFPNERRIFNAHRVITNLSHVLDEGNLYTLQ